MSPSDLSLGGRLGGVDPHTPCTCVLHMVLGAVGLLARHHRHGPGAWGVPSLADRSLLPDGHGGHAAHPHRNVTGAARGPLHPFGFHEFAW